MIHEVKNWKVGVIFILLSFICMAYATRLLPDVDGKTWIALTLLFVAWDRLLDLGVSFIRGFEIEEVEEE
jgi:hypothetical protein